MKRNHLQLKPELDLICKDSSDPNCVVVDMNIYTRVKLAKGAYMFCQLFENP